MKKNNRVSLALLSLSLVCVMALCGTMFSLFHQSAPAYAETVAEPVEQSPAIYVSEKNANSVVGILTNTQTWDNVNGVTDQTVAQGSGVVVAEGGYVLTNNHVIADGTAYQVLMPSGDKVDATLVGSDSTTDLAVLKVDDADAASQLVPVTFGSTEELKVGSTVVAIGNPGGEVLANTVTQGIVSALERTSVSTNNTSRKISYIQHVAAINSGNSCGGLFNYKGELVGINTLKYSGSVYSTTTFEGLGFAIPVETVQSVYPDLIEHGKVIRPALGVTVTNQAGPDEPLNGNAPASVCIRQVTEGGAAEKAGLQAYDFITKVDGQQVKTMADLTTILDQHQVGDTVSVTVVRYNQAGVYQDNSNSLFGYGYGYGYGRNYSNANNDSTGEVVVGGGYEEITVDVTLEELP